MRVLLLAASLVAARALPTRLRTRANAAETALADTKVDGDRLLLALQRLDADLEARSNWDAEPMAPEPMAPTSRESQWHQWRERLKDANVPPAVAKVLETMDKTLLLAARADPRSMAPVISFGQGNQQYLDAYPGLRVEVNDGEDEQRPDDALTDRAYPELRVKVNDGYNWDRRVHIRALTQSYTGMLIVYHRELGPENFKERSEDGSMHAAEDLKPEHVKMRGRFRADDVVPDYGTYGDLIGFTITLHDFLYDDNDGASWDGAIQSDHANQIGDNKIRIRGVTKWTRETIAGFEEFKNALMWTLLHVGEARGR